jgi:hypothetical protein
VAYARTTLTILRARLLERVGGAQKFWVQAEEDFAINEALATWNLLTGDLVTSENKTGVGAGTETISLSATALGPFRITATDGATILTPTTLQDLDQGNYGWRDDANGTPEVWAQSGRDLVWIYPQPDTTAVAGTNDFTVEEYDGAEQLTAAGNYVQLGDEDVTALIDYAQSLLAFKEGVGEGTELAAALQKLFMSASNKRAKWLVGQNPFRNYQGSEKGAATSG